MLELAPAECPIAYWDKTPSRRDGVSASEELELRQKVCRFVLSVASCLGIDDHFSEINAFMLVQSFYNRQSFRGAAVDKYDLGLAALFLSLKLHDRCRTMHELVLAQWRYLSPNAEVPRTLTRRLRDRIECIAAAELLLVATTNFRLEYDTHLALADDAATRCFPALEPREQRALSRYFYYASYHSFWTHAGLFYRPAAVAAACLKLAAAEARRLEGLALRFDAERLAEWAVDVRDVDAIVAILEFGNLHTPGAKSQHDKIDRVDMAGFRAAPSRPKSQRRSREKAAGEPSPKAGQLVRLFDLPPEIKHSEALETCLDNEQMDWVHFILNEDLTRDAVVRFAHEKSVRRLLRKRLFFFSAAEKGRQLKATLSAGASPRAAEFVADADEWHAGAAFAKAAVDSHGATVYVGNMAAGTSEEQLLRAFERFGAVASVRVPRAKRMRPGIFGFVNFFEGVAKTEALRSVVSLNGRTLDVTLRHGDAPEPSAASCAGGVQLEDAALEGASAFDLLDAFSALGAVRCVCLPRAGRGSSAPRNTAFVFFADERRAAEALERRECARLGGRLARLHRLRFRWDTVSGFGALFPVLVRGLPPGSNRFELRAALSRCGDDVADVRLQREKAAGWGLYRSEVWLPLYLRRPRRRWRWACATSALRGCRRV